MKDLIAMNKKKPIDEIADIADAVYETYESTGPNVAAVSTDNANSPFTDIGVSREKTDTERILTLIKDLEIRVAAVIAIAVSYTHLTLPTIYSV